MNEACIWQYIFIGQVCECVCVCVCVLGGQNEVDITLGEVGGCLMMMLDYKGGRGQESGKKWLHNKWML